MTPESIIILPNPEPPILLYPFLTHLILTPSVQGWYERRSCIPIPSTRCGVSASMILMALPFEVEPTFLLRGVGCY